MKVIKHTDPSRYHGEPDVAQKMIKTLMLAAEELSTTLISV